MSRDLLSRKAKLRGVGALRTLLGWAQAPLADVLHAVLPSDCRICGGPMLGIIPVRVCDGCMGRVQALNAAEEPVCRRCGDALGMESARFTQAMGISECTACRLAPPPFARAVSYGLYDGEMRAMLHTLKFSRMRRVAGHVLGPWMAASMAQLAGEAAKSLVVVPVPLFRTRERSRGFNQAELLARAALRRLRSTHRDWQLELRPAALRRTRETHALHSLRPDQRRRGLRGAFEAGDPALVAGREVLLVDDILTTGATARECARVLLRAGATKVWVATVARAQAESIRAVEVSVARWDAPAVQAGDADALRE